MTTTTFPRSQHWTTDGFRVSVLFYKTDPGHCADCGAFPARHYVSASGVGDREGWRGDGARFCDAHRPPRGPLPSLDYVRLVQGEGFLEGRCNPVIYERTEPWPGQSCAACEGPAAYRVEHKCQGCTDPAEFYATQTISLPSGAVGERESHHAPHTLRWEYRCTAHPLELAS